MIRVNSQNEKEQDGIEHKSKTESENEIGLRKFTSKNCFEANDLLLLRFYFFVKVLYSFQTSEMEYFGVILSIKSTFAGNLRCLKSLRTLNNLENACNFYLNSILTQQMKITKIERDCSIMRNKFANSEIFYVFAFSM
jgi:hypothetical protein